MALSPFCWVNRPENDSCSLPSKPEGNSCLIKAITTWTGVWNIVEKVEVSSSYSYIVLDNHCHQSLWRQKKWTFGLKQRQWLAHNQIRAYLWPTEDIVSVIRLAHKSRLKVRFTIMSSAYFWEDFLKAKIKTHASDVISIFRHIYRKTAESLWNVIIHLGAPRHNEILFIKWPQQRNASRPQL